MPFPSKTSTDAIIQSASELIRGDGLASLSMRTLAARLGVRASSLYRHFPDRSSIEATLARHAADELLGCMRRAVEGLTGEQAVLAAAQAYLSYSDAQQSFYDLLMQPSVPSATQSEKTKQIWEFFMQLVSATTPAAGESGAAALWSFLHGFCVLSRSGRLGDAVLNSTFTLGTQALMRGYSALEPEIARSQTQG